MERITKEFNCEFVPVGWILQSFRCASDCFECFSVALKTKNKKTQLCVLVLKKNPTSIKFNNAEIPSALHLNSVAKTQNVFIGWNVLGLQFSRLSPPLQNWEKPRQWTSRKPTWAYQRRKKPHWDKTCSCIRNDMHLLHRRAHTCRSNIYKTALSRL